MEITGETEPTAPTARRIRAKADCDQRLREKVPITVRALDFRKDSPYVTLHSVVSFR